MEKVSALICCANAADTLPAACQSVSWADELVIVDSGSVDATAEIAQRFASRYVLEPWRGYTEQKRFGTALCRNDWIFLLDGDEECSRPLAAEIMGLDPIALNRFEVLLMRRRNYVMRRYVRAYDPDWQSRLFHRQRCHWPAEAVHDARLPSSPSRRGRLRGWIDHKRCSQGGFADYFNGQLADARLKLLSEELYRRGRRCGWSDLCLRPAFAFLKFYILNRGFLDGLFGLLIAQRAAVAVQLKYAALWAYQEAAKGTEQGQTPLPGTASKLLNDRQAAPIDQ